MPKYCLNWVLRIAGNISCQNSVLNASIYGDPNVPRAHTNTSLARKKKSEK